VHNSGGSGEFIPPEYRWNTFEDLKEKIMQLFESSAQGNLWEKKREELWQNISVLKPEKFEQNIWSNVSSLIQ